MVVTLAEVNMTKNTDIALRYFSFRDIYKHESEVRNMFSENMENKNEQRRTDPLNNVHPP